MDKVIYWLNIANYDFETAKAMMITKRWLYVGFMCHQTIEKLLKAYHVQQLPTQTPPYIYSLIRLAESTSIITQMSEPQKTF